MGSVLIVSLLVGLIIAIGLTVVYVRGVRAVLRSFVGDIWLSNELPDAKQKLWETRIKIIAAIGILAGAGWAVYSYNATAERELRKTFWDKQISLYFDATEAASTIATLPDDDPARKIATQRFWQLYFGPLRVVEDDENVGKAMISFGLCLTEPGKSGPMQQCTQDELQQKSLTLAVRCRLSIAAGWDRKLNGLKRL
jgi:hypothetical protein